VNIALIGFGTVGQALAEVLLQKADSLREDYTFTANVVAVATRSRGSLYHPDGLDINCLLDAIKQGNFAHYPDETDLERDWDAQRIASQSNADVVIEASPTNLQTGQPALGLCHTAFDAGKHIVRANKGPIAIAYQKLTEKAHETGKQVLFEATVMAGTPALRLGQQALDGCRITAARGILNGTTNYILTQMENGVAYAQALQQAQALGYAETDPSGDVDGWDAAGKILIISAALFGQKRSFEDMHVEGISHLTLDDIRSAQNAGERWKLIATITPNRAEVRPVRLPLSDPLANVGGVTNALTYTTDMMGDITLIGAGAGRKETGYAILSDLLTIRRYDMAQTRSVSP